MFDKSNPKYLWVSNDSFNGDGTWENPFGKIESALERVQPGNTIILKNGTYYNDITIQVSGTTHMPIKIVAQEKGKVEIHGACWFLYDVCDFIISELTFKRSPNGAISVIGACQRNRFNDLRFIDCGTADKTTCTMFFGGSGAQCNLVENCSFEQQKIIHPEKYSPENAIIGLMVTDGDIFEKDYIKNHVFRRNRFVNYQHGILLGSNDSSENQGSHVIEYNIFENCYRDGITIKCSDTQIRGNLITNCRNNSILIQAGTGSVIENNRITDSNNGILVHDCGHTIQNNCIVRCNGPAITVCGNPNDQYNAANNLLIEKNTCINCGTYSSENRVSGIKIESGTTCIVRKNLFHGEGKPCHFTSQAQETKPDVSSCYLIEDNVVSGKCEIMNGFFPKTISFINKESDNFENDSNYGAQGWMLKPETFNPDVDNVDSGIDYRMLGMLSETIDAEQCD